ncbi:MAG: bifunctional phosphoribosyl-AMP cyclohydrolase/phosphoribosyl-ATP diphosphatase HisIE [Planctomycetes bacterium]|nr:bifunctional phosphoribosyl-AMP cyclohydrolase/phosphoribosyl-ATP diphosphatase HisIE [Planctomycetota bacterium]
MPKARPVAPRRAARRSAAAPTAPAALIPVVAQDVATQDVLMLAWTSPETLRLTRETGYMHYWSRSRGAVWKKGESSGHVQKVVSLHWDCDRDTLLARVEQTGPACHRGTTSCFAARPFPARTLFAELTGIFRDRQRHPSPDSYVCRVLAKPDETLKKVGEEAIEFCLAAKSRRRGATVYEAADLVFHFLLALFKAGVPWSAIEEELWRRRREMATGGAAGHRGDARRGKKKNKR